MPGFLTLLAFLAFLSCLATPFVLARVLWRLSTVERQLRMSLRAATGQRSTSARPEERAASRTSHSEDTDWVEEIPQLEAVEKPKATAPQAASLRSPVFAPKDPPPVPEGAYDPPIPKLPANVAAPEVSPEPQPVPRLCAPDQNPPVSRPTRQSRAPIDIESAIGQRWLVRVGGLILVIGLGFLFRWSIENGLLSEQARVASGAITGLLFWAGGYWSRDRDRPAFSDGLVACGSAILYLTGFAAHALYGLISSPMAFVSMLGVTTATVAFATVRRTEPLALLAAVGAFLVPVLVGNPEAPPHTLMVYLTILNAGLLCVSAVRDWQLLPRLALSGTVLLFARWYFAVNSPGTAMFWGTVLATLFHAATLWRPLVLRNAFSPTALVVLLTNQTLWSALIWHASDARVAGYASLLAACAHVGLAVWQKRRVPHDMIGFGGLATMAVASGVLSCACLLEARVAPAAIGTLGAALLLLGTHIRLRLVVAQGAISLAGAIATTIFHRVRLMDHAHSSFLEAWGTPFLNSGFATEIILISLLFMLARTIPRIRGPFAAMAATALALSFGLEGQLHAQVTFSESFHVLSCMRSLWMIGFTLCGSALLIARQWVEHRQRRVMTNTGSFLLLGGLGCSLAALASLAEGDAPRYVLHQWFLAQLVMPLAAGLVLRFADKFEHAKAIAVGLIAHTLLALTIEGARYASWHLMAHGGGLSPSAAVSVTWSCFGAVLMLIGISTRRNEVRWAALAVFGLTIAKFAVMDLIHLEGLSRIVSVILLGLLLILCAFVYHRFAHVLFPESENGTDGGAATNKPQLGTEG